MKPFTLIPLLVLAASLAACATGPGARIARDTAFTPNVALYSATLAGRYADLSGKPADAARFYTRAHEAMPMDADVLSRAVDASLAAGDVGAAATLTRSVPPVMRPTPGVLALAAYEAANNDRDEALAATRSRPFGPLGSWLSRSIEAWVLADQGKGDQALARLSEPPGLSILDRIADYQRGALYERLGKLGDAETAYAEAWTRGGRFAQGVEAYGRLLERQGKQTEAIAIYDTFLKDVGDNPWVEAARARALAKGAVPPSAQTAGQGAAMAFFGGAAAIGSQADIEAAIPWLYMTLTLDPSHDAARIMLASALSKADREPEAVALWNAIARTSPYYATAQSELAWSLQRDGKKDEAVALAEKAARDTGSERSRAALADMYRATGKSSQAEALYSRMIETAEKGDLGWRLYFARGSMRERLKRYDEADSDFQAALKLSPDEPEVLNYLAYSWVERGINTEKALAMLQTAVAKQPNAGFIVDSLGWAFYKLGRYDEAVAKLEQAAGLDPGDPEINDHLGDAYWRVGRRAEAVFQWRRVLSFKPEADIVTRVQAKLDKGLPEPSPGLRAERK